MISQQALTIRATIRPDAKTSLENVLAEIKSDLLNNSILPFGKLEDVHFARFVFLDDVVDLHGDPIPASLVLTSNFDGSAADHLDQLVDEIETGVDQIFGHCEGYPKTEAMTKQKRLDFLQRHSIKSSAFYVNTAGRSVNQVQQEAVLRDRIEQFLDENAEQMAARSSVEVRQEVQKFVCSQPDLSWAENRAEGQSFGWRLTQKLKVVSVALIGLVLSPILLPLLLIWVVILLRHEKNDVPEDQVPTNKRIQLLRGDEDFEPINQFSAIGFLKPGWFRLLTVRIVLRVVEFGLRTIYNNGVLTGVTTIHFARWILLDDKRRVLFCSNYDGSLESYMNDFIDKVAWGLNAVFSNGVGYPRTHLLLFKGAKQEMAFKNFLRNHQITTQVWYAAYSRWTAVNIRNTAKIRENLFGELSPSETESWLRRF